MKGLVGYITPPTSQDSKNHVPKMLKYLNFPGIENNFHEHHSPNFSLGFAKHSKHRTPDINSFISNDEAVLYINGLIFNKEELVNYLPGKAGDKNIPLAQLIYLLYKEKGVDFLRKLNGQFSIFIYDKTRGNIYLVRDQMGIQPLYYAFHKNILIFGSTVKSVAMHPLVNIALDWNSCMGLSHEYGDRLGFDDGTILQGVKALPEGNYLKYNTVSQDFTIEEYWNLSSDTISFSKNIEQDIYDLVRDAVLIRAKCSDDMSALFSGGLDSSIILSVASQSVGLSTYFNTNILNYQNGDVSRGFQLSQKNKVKTDFLLPSAKGNKFSADDWKQVLLVCENTFTNPITLSKLLLFRYAFNKHSYPDASLFLSGLGSDQFNGGIIQEISGYFGDTQEEQWTHFEENLNKLEYDYALHQKNKNMHTFYPYFKPGYLYDLAGRENFNTSWKKLLYNKKKCFSRLYLYATQQFASHNNIFGLYPFLDHRLISLFFNLDPELYSSFFVDKAILRRIFKDDVGEEIAETSKVAGTNIYQHFGTYELLFDTFKGALFDEAVAYLESEHKNKFNIDSIADTFKEAEETKQFDTIRRPIEILNAALFEASLKEEHPINIPASFVPTGIEPKNHRHIEQSLKERYNIKDQKTLSTDENIVSFKDNAKIVFDKKDSVFLAKENILLFELSDQKWINFLDKIYQQPQELTTILETLDIDMEHIQDCIDIALEYDILEITS